ncbi:MAG TPA: tetratricopeptide repeat protein [Pyrinomonadaceae bacterium]|nr:tetratricopeptide repeat protein [Pyrinomonadaceae bacterium]
MSSRSNRCFLALVSAVLSVGLSTSALGQDGGGTLNRDLIGGALLIFRTPDNPPVGGGRLQGHRITPKVAKEQNRIIARANAARSAPTPRFAEAEEQYRQAATLDPTDARSYAGLGNVYLDQKRFVDAVAQYKHAIELKPDYSEALMPLGYAHVSLNQLSDAIEDYKQALKVEPSNPEIHNNLGYLYNHSERYEESVAACLEAIRLLGETGESYKQGFQTRQEVLAHAYKNLGNAYNGLKNFEQAAKALRQATVIEPKNASAFFNLGVTLYSARRYSEAIEAYKEVIKLRPSLVAARFNLGLTYLAINDKKAATAEYDALKPLDPNAAEQLRLMIRQ